MIKRLICILLVLIMVGSLFACSKADDTVPEEAIENEGETDKPEEEAKPDVIPHRVQLG